LAEDVEAFRRDVLSDPRQHAEILREVAQMRARIAAAKSADSPWEAKIGPGRMQDIELVGQAAALLSGKGIRQIGRALRNADWMAAADRDALTAAYGFFWALQIGGKLVSEEGLDPDTMGPGGRGFLRRLTGCNEGSTLAEAVQRHAETSAATIDRLLDAYDNRGQPDAKG
jgi:glutamate-ammonia-ligase adenylyltransferase